MTWETWVVVICLSISFICKLGIAILEAEKKAQDAVPSNVNRTQRRHPNGHVAAQKFQRVSVKGRQKQGNNRAFKGW